MLDWCIEQLSDIYSG